MNVVITLVLWMVCLAISLILAHKKDRLTHVVAIMVILFTPLSLFWALGALDYSEAGVARAEARAAKRL